jgi:hypothetical protein
VLVWVAQAAWAVWLAEHRSQAVLAQVEGGVVDFARVGPSDWERVYFFHPYTPAERIHQALGFHWTDAGRTSVSYNDRVNLVLFVRGVQVVGWFEHPRNRGDLTDLAVPGGYARDAARFLVVRDVQGQAVLVAP